MCLWHVGTVGRHRIEKPLLCSSSVPVIRGKGSEQLTCFETMLCMLKDTPNPAVKFDHLFMIFAFNDINKEASFHEIKLR